mmetsp:Transcript_19483/g.35826  ORF Transcript_19483/g.35826 Transcript_19483/m.35826 type:complete len:382 (+) Transcript_19483:1178-2323(+)
MAHIVLVVGIVLPSNIRHILRRITRLSTPRNTQPIINPLKMTTFLQTPKCIIFKRRLHPIIPTGVRIIIRIEGYRGHVPQTSNSINPLKLTAFRIRKKEIRLPRPIIPIILTNLIIIIGIPFLPRTRSGSRSRPTRPQTILHIRRKIHLATITSAMKQILPPHIRWVSSITQTHPIAKIGIEYISHYVQFGRYECRFDRGHVGGIRSWRCRGQFVGIAGDLIGPIAVAPRFEEQGARTAIEPLFLSAIHAVNILFTTGDGDVAGMPLGTSLHNGFKLYHFGIGGGGGYGPLHLQGIASRFGKRASQHHNVEFSFARAVLGTLGLAGAAVDVPLAFMGGGSSAIVDGAVFVQLVDADVVAVAGIVAHEHLALVQIVLAQTRH